MDNVLEKLNQECHAAGVCEGRPVDSEALLSAPGIKHARIMHQDKGLAVLTCVYNDGVVASCSGKIEDGKFKSCSCYSSEPGQEPEFFAWVAHLAAVGYKEQAIEVGGKEASLIERVH